MAEREPELLKVLVQGDEREIRVSRSELYEVLDWLFPGERALHADLEVVAMKTIAQSVPLDAYELRIGEWRIDLQARFAQSAIAASALAGAIGLTGPDSVPVILLALVLPFLVDIERVELRTRDRIIRAYLKEGLDPRAPEVAYEALPADIRSQLSLLEFADTLDRLEAAGMLRTEQTRAPAVEAPSEVALTVGSQDATDQVAIYLIEARLEPPERAEG